MLGIFAIKTIPKPYSCISEPTSSDDFITKHYISSNTFYYINCVSDCVLNKMFIFF